MICAGRSSVDNRRSNRVREGTRATPAMPGIPEEKEALRRRSSAADGGRRLINITTTTTPAAGGTATVFPRAERVRGGRNMRGDDGGEQIVPGGCGSEAFRV